MANIDKAIAALADPTRRQIWEGLADGPRSVGDIASRLPVSRPAVSQHLKVLREAGLVTDRAEGTRRIYRIDPNGLGALRAWLDRFWTTNLDAFRRVAEATHRPASESADSEASDTGATPGDTREDQP